jgi:hypothetical protein
MAMLLFALTVVAASAASLEVQGGVNQTWSHRVPPPPPPEED